ncbi:MAG: hypothetical protein UX00_C0007G0095 [Microgenomates group bacterium GW2011_GWB1_45_17]|nr:MAG: hypothetical protein UX00_C0007G0095 [Microgenomates group bacterium GW2011_GWB1_45_17]
MITPTVFPSEIPIYVGDSKIPGVVRGIMASRDIKKGELIEKCPLVFIPISEEKYIKNTVIWKYYFEPLIRAECTVLARLQKEFFTIPRNQEYSSARRNFCEL